MHRLDSLENSRGLNHALEYAKQHLAEDAYFQHLLLHFDSSYSIEMDLQFGALFEKSKKHLLVRRTYTASVFFDFFELETDSFIHVFTEIEYDMGFNGDTLYDVNGDGYKDFLIERGTLNGCCLADHTYVFLYQFPGRKFSERYSFVNATFFPKEKIIRGVGGGHSGETGLYKYRWNGSHIDTIEYIYPDVICRGQYIKTKGEFYKPTINDGVVLKAVPKEYHKIKAFDWFTGEY